MIIEGSELHLARVSEYGSDFETGVPVRLSWMHNLQKAPPPPPGDPYQQKIEPAGFYCLHASQDMVAHRPALWEAGEVDLRSPLVLLAHPRMGEPDGWRTYDDQSWKARLSRALKAKGKDLTRRLLTAGHDAIVTVSSRNGGPTETGEVVILEPSLIPVLSAPRR